MTRRAPVPRSLLLAAVLAAAIPAQDFEPVPDFGAVPNDAATGVSLEEEFVVAAQTSLSRPGISFRIQPDVDEPWGPVRTRVLDPTSVGLEPTVVVVDEDIFLCWVERVGTGSTRREQLVFDTSFDEGDTWTGPAPMQPPPGDPSPVAEIPAYHVLASPQGIVLVTLERGGLGATARLALRRSTDGGRTFAPTVTVASDVTPVAAALEVAASATALHCAWLAATPNGDTEVRLRSFDAATLAAAGPAVTLASGTDDSAPGDASPLALEAAGQELVVAWRLLDPRGNTALQCVTSADEGRTRAPVRTLFDGSTTARDASGPQLAVHDRLGLLTVLWSESGPGGARIGSATLAAADGRVLAAQRPIAGEARGALLHKGDQRNGALTVTAVVGDRLVAASSADAGIAWRAPRVVEGLPGLPVEPLARGQFDDVARDHPVSALVAASSGRPPTQFVGRIGTPRVGLVPGTVAEAGAPLQFALSGFGARSVATPFLVVWSATPALTPLPGGGALGLRLDALSLLSLQLPQLGGVLDAGGFGATLPLQLPDNLPAFDLWVAAVALPAGSARWVNTPATRVPVAN